MTGDFVEKIVRFCRDNPHLAKRTYANTAARMRSAAQACGVMKTRLEYDSLATIFDNLSSERFSESETEQSFFDQVIEDNRARDTASFGADIPPQVTARGISTEFDDFTKTGLDQHPASGGVSSGDSLGGGNRNTQTPPSAADTGNLFGNQALVQYGGNQETGAQQETQVIFWKGKTSESQACTISFSRIGGGAGATYPSAGNSFVTYYYRPYARLRWGTSNATPNEAIVDIGNGNQITLCAAFVYASVGMDPVSFGGIAQSGSMMLSGQMGFYSVGRQAPSFKTLYADSINSFQNQDFTIPNFATSLNIYSTLPGSAHFTVDVLDAAGHFIYEQVVTGPAYFTPMQLSNDASIIKITNNSDSIPFSGRLIFTLSL